MIDAAMPSADSSNQDGAVEVPEEGLLAYTETKSICALLDD
ncbi:hypothetical protein ACTMU2_15825 [Cupriavidus basilensis]